VPCDLTREEIGSEIIALNLKGLDAPRMKIIYIFLPKRDCSTTNCVLEVTPNVRSYLLSDRLVCIGYFACRVTDYIRVCSVSGVLLSVISREIASFLHSVDTAPGNLRNQSLH